MRKFQLWHLGVLFLISLSFGVPALAGEPSVSINRGDSTTKTRAVTLWLVPRDTAQYVRISNTSDISTANWESFFSQKNWTLEPGIGNKTVYVQFQDRSGLLSPVLSDSIQLSIPSNVTLDFSINNNSSETNSRYVDLVLNYSDGIEHIAIGNSLDTLESPVLVQKNLSWVLSPATGDKTVYIKYTDAANNSKVVSKKIRYKQPGRYLKEGTLLKGQGDTIYYYGYDGKTHAFLHSAIYHSWFKDFVDLTVVSQQKLHEYQVGNPICLRPGTWLLKFDNSARVYAVEPGCTLRPIRSESEAYILYGKNWQKRIMKMDPFYEIFYRVKDTSQYPFQEDRDRDGIDYRQEQMYGSSDTKVDSDYDGISDYEEIIYWFSDPILADTDGDSVPDGREITLNQSPVGFRELKSVPENTYEYPLGSVIYDAAAKSSVYRSTDGLFYTYSPKKTTTKTDDRTISFADNFIIQPTILVPFKKAKTSASSDPMFLRYPVIPAGNGFIAQ